MPSKLTQKVKKRLNWYWQECRDTFAALLIKELNKRPSAKETYLLVGSESSGTTAIANLLFLEIPALRFLEEGDHQWVWDVYQEVYQGHKTIRDYPKLHLFDAIKVPGFATIIPQFREVFPNTKVIYVVRDPRDYVNSAIKTWKVNSIGALSDISWVKENWHGIQNTDPIERLAMRWKLYINSAMAQPNLIFVRYEDFWHDKVGTIQRLANQVGLPFNEPRVAELCDKQLCEKSVRAYKPMGPDDWKIGILQPEHISKIEKICRIEMSAWNYVSKDSTKTNLNSDYCCLS